MRDPEYLIQLLKEMSDRADGRILCPKTLDSDESALNRYHHVEQLVDADHAEWVNKLGVARIRSQGYEFLNAIESQPEAKIEFLHLLSKGVSYADAVAKAINLVEKLI